MRCLYLPMKKPLEYSVCGQLISKEGFLHHRRTFEHHVLIFVTEGTLHITANGDLYDVSANQYIFLPAGEEHLGTAPSDGKLSYFWVHIIPRETLSANTPAPKEAHGPYYSFPEYATLPNPQRSTRLFRQLMELSAEKHPYCADMQNYTLSLLLMEITKESTHSSQPSRQEVPAPVASLCQWLQNNYHRPFSLSEAASQMGYQPGYLSKLFKNSMGISPITYTNRLRVDAAKNLLEVYGLSTKETAYSCGFADEKYFMKVFKVMVGCTPTEYKKPFFKN